MGIPMLPTFLYQFSFLCSMSIFAYLYWEYILISFLTFIGFLGLPFPHLLRVIKHLNASIISTLHILSDFR